MQCSHYGVCVLPGGVVQPAFMCLSYFVCFPVTFILKLSNAIWKVYHSYTVWPWAGNMINKLLSATSAEHMLQVVLLDSTMKRIESLCKYEII